MGLLTFLWPIPTWAISENDCSQKDQTKQEAIDCWNQLIGETKNREESLTNEITKINASIALTTAQIKKTQNQIAVLGQEIEALSAKIERLEQSLGDLSNVLLERIVATYKQGNIEPFHLLLSSNGFSEFLTRLKYIRVVQTHDKKLMFEMQETKDNYTDQKTLREEKKREQELLGRQLESQKAVLAQQVKEKQTFLDATNNDERRYQQLLAQARAQQAAFGKFVSSQGGASILQNQTFHDGWGYYYNQRDASWGNMTLGNSGYTMANAGCLVSSSAMVATHYGKNINPGDIAADDGAFFGSTGWLWKDVTVNGIHIVRTSVSGGTSTIDSELGAGRPVIVGLFWSGGSPEHFIVLKSGSGGNYIMNDPFVENGHDINFTSRYSVGDISEVEKVSVN